jgi:hypothetical protein
MTGEQYDAPNQQVVRPDGSGPADVGDGMGQPPAPPEGDTTKTKTKPAH